VWKEAVYEYLESLQKKSDLHFQNFERRQLRVDRRIDILPALKREDSHGTVPLVWDGYGL